MIGGYVKGYDDEVSTSKHFLPELDEKASSNYHATTAIFLELKRGF